jgi:hypothetical protein
MHTLGLAASYDHSNSLKIEIEEVRPNVSKFFEGQGDT